VNFCKGYFQFWFYLYENDNVKFLSFLICIPDAQKFKEKFEEGQKCNEEASKKSKWWSSM